jgi:ABC-type xylose transport system substrate-binding protein
VVALLLPESKTARYETQNRPAFQGRMRELCPDCEILYSNANQDAAKQQQQAEAAAELAYALLMGQEPPEGLVTGTLDNGFKEVSVVLLDPIEVTIDNVLDTIIADGFWSVEQICSEEYAAACAAAGIE